MTAGYLIHTQPLALICALLAATLMGFSIQQGGTCMVGAVSQLVNERRGGRVLALLECSLWVLALGLAAMIAGVRFQASPQFPLAWPVVAGGILLGLGALANGACVFGSIARIGNRDVNYLLTPPGYFLGSLAHAGLVGAGVPGMPMEPSPGAASIFLLLIFAGSLALSISQIWVTHREPGVSRPLWDYRHATITIGIAFVVLSIVAGPWTYTEALGKAAHGGGFPAFGQMLLLAALLGGAVLGGARGMAGVPLSAPQAALCFGGGALMGFGASLVPGGNDNLILAGVPWLQPHALVAIAAMTFAIAAGLLSGRLWRKLASIDFKSRKGRV